jgi:heme-degrading monooxygenase HmoA
MIRVMIERYVQPDKDADVIKLLIELRARALKQHGYISGETLRSMDNPSLWLTISTWNCPEDWKQWEKTADRKEIAYEIEQLLTSPENITAFEFVK